ncbi:MAG TPA: hypothetical protein VGO07_07505 [Candidatus Saccharimonadales bacterium]|nr:hypothetical protein [Candidatus Saccharimonadales bacterium]
MTTQEHIGQVLPVDVEVAAGPIDMATVDAGPITQPATELASGTPTFPEHVKALQDVVTITARRDELSRKAYANANYIVGGAGLAYVVTELFTAAASRHVSDFGLGSLLVGAAAVVEVARANIFSDVDKVEMLQGYGIQCLRAGRQSERLQSGDVTAVVLPRSYGKDVEPATLAPHRLADALEVVAAAAEQDPKLKQVIIPASVARRAGLPYEGNATLKDAIHDSTTQRAKIPGDSHDRALVVPAARAKELAEQARMDPDALLTRVLSEVAARYSGKREALHEKNAKLVKVLHGLVARAAGEGAGVRTKQRDMQRVIIADGIDGQGKTKLREVNSWRGGWKVDLEDVTTRVDTSNPYNPHLHNTASKSGTQLDSSDLRRMTGGDETMLGIVRKLSESKYDNLTLLRVALQLLEGKQQKQEHIQQKAVEAAVGGTPQWIGLAPRREQTNYNRHRARLIGRAAVAAGLAFATAGAASATLHATLGNHNKKSVEAPAPCVPATPVPQLWRVDAHDLQPAPGYWAQTTFYNYTAKGGWAHRKDHSKLPLDLPDTLPTSTPHITVSGVGSGNEYTIPLPEGDDIVAVRASDGKDLPVQAYRHTDGTTFVQVGTTGNCDNYRIAYDLIPAVHPIRPSRTLDVQGAETIINPAQYPGATEGAAAQATALSEGMVYDADDNLNKVYGANPTPGDFVQTLYANGRCMCSICNPGVAMVQAAVNPDQKLAYVNGWNGVNMGTTHGYLGGGIAHAWLDDGTVIDSTASKMDARSVVPHPPALSVLDDTWHGQQVHAGLVKPPEKHSPSPFMPLLPWLGGIAASALLGVELRKHYMRRIVSEAVRGDAWLTAAADIDPRDAVRLLGWQAYGTQASKVPAIDGGESYQGEQANNIPTKVLEAVQHGGFHADGQLTPQQARGLRHTAGAILRDRRHDARRTAGRRKK